MLAKAEQARTVPACLPTCLAISGDFILANDQYYMQIALELAAQAEGHTTPNPMVGAVITKDDVVIGKGYHLRAGTAHAEIDALRDAGEQARGATLYVTLEPCCHHGRTPPCTKAIIKAGIKRVVVAMIDPNPLMAGKGLADLKRAGIQFATGVMTAAAVCLNEEFIKFITTKLPFVVLKAAVSLDGKIATVTGESQWITGPESRAYTHRLRHKYAAILVGINTVLADNPLLTARLPVENNLAEQKINPVRIILDSKCRIPLDAKVINRAAGSRTIIATTKAARPDKIKALQSAGAEVLVITDSDGLIEIPALLKALGQQQITSLLVEGGAGVHGSFLTAKVVDKVYWFIAPVIIGGVKAPGAVGGRGIENLVDAIKLKQVEVQRLGADICVVGRVGTRHEMKNLKP